MASHLSPDQRATLQAALHRRRAELQGQFEQHQEGASRVEHARAVLEQDADDAPQRDADREIDLALSDMEAQEMAAVDAALQRLQAGRYGRCSDCDAEIAYERLRLEPWARRCVACEAKRERGQRRASM